MGNFVRVLEGIITKTPTKLTKYYTLFPLIVTSEKF